MSTDRDLLRSVLTCAAGLAAIVTAVLGVVMSA